MFRKSLAGLLIPVFVCGLSIFAIGQRHCAAEERFIPVAEGTMDTQTGLVWGFELYATGDYLLDIGVHVFGGSLNSWEFANAGWLNCFDENGNELPGGFCDYTQFSNWFAGRDDNDWRLPTKDEMVDAAKAGIDDHLDISPEPGIQLMVNPWHYSSDLLKYRGMPNVYIVDLGTGEFINAHVNSMISAFMVHGALPPEPPSKPGKGKKK